MESKVEEWLKKRSQDIKEEWKNLTGDRLSLCDSPIEKLFLVEWEFATVFASDFENLYLIPQYKIGNYRVDFLVYYIPPNILPIKEKDYLLNNKKTSLIIELDSYLWHGSDPEQFAKEKERERELKKEGWNIMRFSGREIYRNVEKCIYEVLDYLMDIKYGDFLKRELEQLEKGEKEIEG